MATQVSLTAEPRPELGKGPTGRLRKTGRVPAIVYGTGVEPTALHVDALELYHTLHTAAGSNVLIRLSYGGDEQLSIVREIQRHPVRGEVLHVDFQAVDRDQLIPADIPVHTANDASVTGGIINTVLHTVPIHVRPLEVPGHFTVDLEGKSIGDVVRVGDLADQLPTDATFDIDEQRTVVTINAPTVEAVEPEEGEGALAEFAGGPAADEEDESAEG